MIEAALAETRGRVSGPRRGGQARHSAPDPRFENQALRIDKLGTESLTPPASVEMPTDRQMLKLQHVTVL